MVGRAKLPIGRWTGVGVSAELALFDATKRFTCTNKVAVVRMTMECHPDVEKGCKQTCMHPPTLRPRKKKELMMF